jgi:hypothetical protein
LGGAERGAALYEAGVAVATLEVGGVFGVFDVFQNEGVEKIGVHAWFAFCPGMGFVGGSIVENPFQAIPTETVG